MPLAFDRLAWPVNRAIGEEDRLLERTLALGLIRVVVSLRSQLAPVVARPQEVAATIVGADAEEAIVIGFLRQLRVAVALVVQSPRLHLRAAHRSPERSNTKPSMLPSCSRTTNARSLTQMSVNLIWLSSSPKSVRTGK